VIIQDAGVHAPLAIGAYSAIPYGIGAVGIVLISRHSDKVRERRWHYSLCAFFGACALGLISVPFGSLPITLTLMGITVALVLGSIPVFWALPPKYLGRGGALAGGIALISSIGSLGGFVSPYVIGLVRQTTGSMVFGIGAMAVLLAISSVILLVTTRETTGADGTIDPILNTRESKNAST
jgi:nitrate/nitrite transporter NarK